MGWDNDHWDYMRNGGYGYHGVGMGILFVLLIALAIWAILRITRHDRKQAPQAPHAAVANKETPREILDRRFANGELSAEEYQKAKELLNQ